MPKGAATIETRWEDGPGVPVIVLYARDVARVALDLSRRGALGFKIHNHQDATPPPEPPGTPGVMPVAVAA